MVVSAPTTTLLLAASVVAPAAEPLAVVSVRAAAVLATTAGAAHAIAAAVNIMSLKMTGVTAVTSAANLGVLRWEAALAAGRIVGRRSGPGSTTKRGRRARGIRLAITKRLQLISRARRRGLVLAVVRLALGLQCGRTASIAVVGSAIAAGASRLTTSLARSRATVFTQSGAEAAVTVKRRRRAGKSAGRRRVVVGSIGRHAIRLSIHATLTTVGAKATLPVSRVVLMVIRVAIVGVAVPWVLTVGLRLRARHALLSLLTLLALLALLALLTLLAAVLAMLLRLNGGVGGRMTTVLAVARAAESRLVVQGATLRVLAEIVCSIVPSKWPLLRGAVVLAMSAILLLGVGVVRSPLLMTRRVVVGVLARRGREGSTRLLTLNLGLAGGNGVAVEWGLSDRGSLSAVVEGTNGLLNMCGSSSGRRVRRSESAVLLLDVCCRSLSSCRGGRN